MSNIKRIIIKDKKTCAVCGAVVANGEMAQAARVYICNSCVQEMVKNPIVEIKADGLMPGQPCSHPGCCAHITHPCEVCGRTGCC